MYSVNAILPMEFFFFSRFVGEREGCEVCSFKIECSNISFHKYKKKFLEYLI